MYASESKELYNTINLFDKFLDDYEHINKIDNEKKINTKAESQKMIKELEEVIKENDKEKILQFIQEQLSFKMETIKKYISVFQDIKKLFITTMPVLKSLYKQPLKNQLEYLNNNPQILQRIAFLEKIRLELRYFISIFTSKKKKDTIEYDISLPQNYKTFFNAIQNKTGITNKNAIENKINFEKNNENETGEFLYTEKISSWNVSGHEYAEKVFLKFDNEEVKELKNIIIILIDRKTVAHYRFLITPDAWENKLPTPAA